MSLDDNRFGLDKRELDRWITREDTGHYPQCEECPVVDCEAAPNTKECKDNKEKHKYSRGCAVSRYEPNGGCPLLGDPECPCTCSYYEIRDME